MKQNENLCDTSQAQNRYELHSSYLDIAEQSCMEFQEHIRKSGLRTFNVWLYLEKEFLTHYIENKIDGRKPPKAVTIQQWFRNDQVTSTKLGTEDLRLICKFINNSIPLVAYYEQAIKDFNHPRTFTFGTKTLNGLISHFSKLSGSVIEEYLNSIEDGVMSEDEAVRLIDFIESLNQHSATIVGTLKTAASCKD